MSDGKVRQERKEPCWDAGAVVAGNRRPGDFRNSEEPLGLEAICNAGKPRRKVVVSVPGPRQDSMRCCAHPATHHCEVPQLGGGGPGCAEHPHEAACES